MAITRETARKVLEIVDAGLCKGVGRPVPGQMCVEQAVTFALGEQFSDAPSCVSQALRSLKIMLNDSDWSSNAARAKGMRRLAIMQLGTKDTLNESEFFARVAEMTIRTVVAQTLRHAAERQTDEKQIAALKTAADRCEKEGTKDAAHAATAAAVSAAEAARAAYATTYAYSAAYVATNAANAYTDSTRAIYAVAHAAANSYSIRDQVLGAFAELVVQILIEMKAPATEWLDLTEAA